MAVIPIWVALEKYSKISRHADQADHQRKAAVRLLAARHAEAIRSCSTPLENVAGKNITTIEGLSHPLQKAFIEEQAVQCGYCMNGMIMQAKALLDTNKRPSEAEIRQALAKNLCRCGTHVRIIRAVKRASETMA